LVDLFDHPALDEARCALKGGKNLLVEELWEGPKALLIALALEQTGRPLVVVTDDSRLYTDLPAFTSCATFELPAWDTLEGEEQLPSTDIIGDRLELLSQLQGQEGPMVLICSVQAASQPVTAADQLRVESIEVGQQIAFERFCAQLEEMGYQRAAVASEKGEYAVRGGIVDLYPVSSPDPFRIEFWGDEIDSIRLFDPVGQKSVHTVDHFRLTSAHESSRTAHVSDYFPKGGLLVLDDLAHIEDRAVALGKSDFLTPFSDWQTIYLADSQIEELGGCELLGRSFSAERWRHPFYTISDALPGDDLVAVDSSAKERGVSVRYLCDGEGEEERLRKVVPEASISQGYLSSGFVLPKKSVAVVPMTEFSHRYKIRRQKQRSTHHTAPSEFLELEVGQHVVHLQSGIGRYLGVERQKNHMGQESEFLTLEYAKGGKLFVPLTQSHMVSRYIGSGEEAPQLHQLGSKRWRQTKAATERAIRDYAADLLELYAERQMIRGESCPPDSEEVAAFERDFAYVETEDQLEAIRETKGDQMSPKPMDRLICGDVGYGKTEVAMRAAFKAVMDGGKQVALLVPTTVLALQHFETFSERMSGWPIEVALLTRHAQSAQLLKRVSNGEVDILIGTHRLLSKDVDFKNLGLVIIDEEHRFGVRSKERLRAIKSSVDCLALSATPIPRTLYMSLVGARDLSSIATPPQDRLPIQTILSERNDEVIRQAIERELARDGQVYFLHNRVESLPRVAEHLQRLVPRARIGVGHGQMGADAMDKLFHKFKSGDLNLLIATTIIESGIDIPNANTILIDRADTFGMADLYQLRGRVGRWNRRAYCYFLVPRRRELSEEARQRLSALIEVGGYGGGMKVAMRDLEIRGAGNILGTRQSGHVSAIGFHLYCKMLKRTISQLQGKLPAAYTDVKLEFPQDARIPDSYIREAKLRMEIYQRFGEAYSLEEVDALFEEVRDRFGKPPEPVLWLYHLMRIRVWAACQRIETLRWQRGTLTAERQGKLTSKQVRDPTSPADFEQLVLDAQL